MNWKYTFQQDTDPLHINKSTEEWLQKNKKGQSTDMNLKL